MPPPFRALVQRAMRARQQRLLALAVLVTYVLASLATTAWRAPRLFVLATTAALTLLVVLPLLLWRRRLLRDARAEPMPLTRAAFWAHAASSRAIAHSAAGHAALGALAALLLALTQTHLQGWAAPLAPMRFVPAHDAYYVNEAFLWTIGTAALSGAAYALAMLRRVPGGRRAVPPAEPRSTATTLRADCVAAVPVNGARAWRVLAVAPLSLGAYWLVREAWWSFVLRLVGVDTPLRRWLVPSFLVPLAPGHWLRHGVPVLWATLTLFESVHTLFDVYWTHPLPYVATRAKDSVRTLLDGLEDPHPFFQAHAFSELARLAQSSKGRREALFRDVQRPHGLPPASVAVAAACRRVLDHTPRADSAPPPRTSPAAPTPTPAPTPASAPTPTAPPTAPPARDAEGRSSARAGSVWHVLASRAPRHAEPSTAAPTAAPTPALVSGPAAPAAPTAPAPGCAPSWPARAAALAQRVWQLLPAEARHVVMPATWHAFLLAPVPRLWLDAHLLPQRATACWAAQAAQALVLASVDEDVYGSLQPEVPKLAVALEAAHARVVRARRELEATALEADRALVHEARAVRGALEEAGADASTTTLAPSLAPFSLAVQTAWEPYRVVEDTLHTAHRAVAQAYAPYS